MQFPNVIAQTHLLQQLQQMEANNRLSHAILLVGKEGCGALPIAVNFAQNLVSRALPSRTVAAGSAPAVADLFGGLTALPSSDASDTTSTQAEPLTIDGAAAVLQHPDLHFSYPVVPKKAGDAPLATDYIKEWREFFKLNPYGNVFDWLQFINAENRQGNITADECNEITRKLSMKAFKATCKVLVMWMPEFLGKEGNKLLKLIEEPPPDTLFLLVAENEEQVLPTIVSRCQVIRVLPLSDADVETALVQRCQLTPQAASQIALVCEGNYREALQLMQHNEEDWNSLLRDWLNAALLKGPQAFKRFDMQTKIVAQLAELGREKQKQLLRYFLQLIEQCLRLRLMGEQSVALPEAEKAFALRLNKMSGLSTQRAIATELEQAIYYIERNANPKMLFQALTLKLRSIVLDKTILLTA